MKKFLAVFLAFLLCFLLSGCALFDLAGFILHNAREESSSSSDLPEIQEEPSGESEQPFEFDVPEPSESPVPDLTVQEIGTQELGYLEVPEDWVRFFDLDGTSALQYSNPAGTSIITLDTFDLSGLTEEEKGMVTAEDAAGSVWYNMEGQDVTDITGARVTLNDLEAYQVYGNFISEDFGLDSCIVCWIFEGGDGVLHYVSAEATVEDILDVVSYVEGSYHLDAAE